MCVGYRDEASLIFRYENEKVEQTLRRRASDVSSVSSGRSSKPSLTGSSATPPSDFSLDDFSDLSIGYGSEMHLQPIFPWLNNGAQEDTSSTKDPAVTQFFENFVVYPCSEGSSLGFLEHLPCMFNETAATNRIALRYAVQAAAYANASQDLGDKELFKKSMHCYGQALSALSKSLLGDRNAADDYVLMTVVILDIFESMFLEESSSKGSHAEGMKQILRLRGPNQMYSARGWSLFQLSHHRVVSISL